MTAFVVSRLLFPCKLTWNGVCLSEGEFVIETLALFFIGVSIAIAKLKENTHTLIFLLHESLVKTVTSGWNTHQHIYLSW